MPPATACRATSATTLAAEDLEWRRENNGRLLERLFNVNVYYSSYKPMSLDQHLELERLRQMGVWTPSAPPDPEIKSSSDPAIPGNTAITSPRAAVAGCSATV